MKRILSLAIAAGFLGITLTAAAEEWSIEARPGMSIPTGDIADFIKDSFDLGLAIQRPFSETVEGGLELDYAFDHKLEGTVEGVDFTSNLHGKVFSLGPVVKFGPHTGSFKPYFALGARWYYYFPESGTISGTGAFTGFSAPIEFGSDSDFGLNGGVGFLSAISATTEIGIDLRYHRSFESGDDAEFIIPSLVIRMKL